MARSTGIRPKGIADQTMESARIALAGAADAAYRGQIEMLVPGIRTLGVRVPRIRALAADLDRDAALDVESAMDVLDSACADGSRDEILLGIFLLARFHKALPALPWPRIAGWLAAVDNWETCDQLAMTIAAPAVAANDDLLAQLKMLARDRNLWARRFALATAAALTQKGRGRTDACLEIAALLVRDAEPMVQKALAWALREASEAEPDAVAALLRQHKAALSPRVLREASEKLPAAVRAKLAR